MSNTFFSSDIHFGHANIIKYCDRPFSSVDEMDETIIDRHNSVVKPGDAWYFLGDLSFYKDPGKTAKLFDRMNGVKYWVPGNHDDTGGVVLKHWAIGGDSYLLEVLPPLVEIKHLSRRPVTLCHFPMLSWNQSHRGAIQLHGHVHSKNPFPDPAVRRMDVGVDGHNFYPWEWEEIRQLMQKIPVKE